MKKAAFYLLALMACLLAGGKAYAQATVTTDQSDYPPGSTVNITGSGFAPGETVQLQVLNVTDPTDTGPEHDPWTVTADTNGNFTATWYVTSDEANMTLQLTATGLTSGLVAQTTFMDSIGVPASIGQNNSATTDTSLSVTVGAGGVAAGNTIIVSFAINTTSASAVTVADTKGNNYTQDANILNSAGSIRTMVFSAPVTTALVSGNTITVTYPSATTKAVSIYYVSGLVSSAPADKSVAATGNSTTPSSGSTATLSQANELCWGAIGGAYHATTTFTVGSGYTALTSSLGDGGSSSSSATIQPEYQIVSATTATSAGATLSATREWAAAIVTYKAFTNATQLAFTTQPVTTTAGSTMANVVVQIQNQLREQYRFEQRADHIDLEHWFICQQQHDNRERRLRRFGDVQQSGHHECGQLHNHRLGFGIGAGLASATSSSFTINAAAASQLSITNSVVTVTAGVASSVITVQRQDQYGNPATNGTTTVNLTTSSATGSFTNAAGTSAITSTNILPNASTASYLYRDTVAGSPTITNSATGLTSDTQVVTVIPAAASKLAIKTEPSATATAGVAFTTQPAVYVEDQFGNVATNDSSTVTAALATGTGPLQGTATATPSLGVATFNNLADNLAESIKLKYTDGVLTPATNTTTIVVGAAAASKLVITSTAVTNTAGVASSNITVQRQDAFGNPNTTDAARTVTLASTSTGTVTFTPASVTIATGLSSTNFTYTDTQAGTPTITAASTSPSTITSATQVETVKPAAVDHFVISAISSPQTAGTAITGITLTAQDVYNNTATNFTTTVAYSGTAGITGTSAAFTLGVLSGVSVTPTVAGSGLTFVVTGSTKTGTNTFNVNPGALANYLVSAAPTTRGTAFNVTVTARDAYGNTVTTPATPVTLTSSTTNVVFTGNPVTPSSGTFTVSAVDNYFETVTITATDTNSITGNTNVTVNGLSGDYRSQANGSWNAAGTWENLERLGLGCGEFCSHVCNYQPD